MEKMNTKNNKPTAAVSSFLQSSLFVQGVLM